ncbi:MAG: hypothetical protein JNM18_04495 [Planctomycetaceae bacterium]|nr:hypothetical protein [Planctomycetaceae bacterium]
MSTTLSQVYDRLRRVYGEQRMVAAASAWERLVGAILLQHASWSAVENALTNLRESGIDEPRAMRSLAVDELAELIQPTGHGQTKAKRLLNLLKLLHKQHDDSVESLLSQDRHALREQLMGVNGISAEVADTIVLYAAELPVFVVNLATHRILARHGWIDFEADYETIQDHLQGSLQRDVPLYAQFHEMLTQVGDEFCRKTPKCDGCPLQPLLRNGQPLEPYG